jgi:hypothetical protein
MPTRSTEFMFMYSINRVFLYWRWRCFLWRKNWILYTDIFSHGATAPSGSRPPHYRGFTIILRHTTLGRTPLDERSARRRDLQLTTHNTHNRHISMPPMGYEPAAADLRLRLRGRWDRRVSALWKLNLCLNRQTWFWFSNLISCLTQPVPSFAIYNNLNTLYM